MKERQILFSGPMVRALLDGRKTQTRRSLRKQFPADAVMAEIPATDPMGGWVVSGHSGLWWDDAASCFDDAMRCPYGIPGDRLWVRETWRIGAWDEDESAFAIDYRDGPRREWLTDPTDCDGERFKNLWIQCCDELRAKGIEPGEDGRHHWQPGNSPLRWRPSIHMPRWASRITLEITAVRIERLQDIIQTDAINEGLDRFELNGRMYWRDYSLSDDEAECSPMRDDAIGSYRTLWESINRPGSWDANPLVWVAEFKRIKP